MKKQNITIDLGKSFFVVIFWVMMIIYFTTKNEVFLNNLFIFMGIKLIADWWLK